MEERATIARELHDSLAQVLSYLRIQLTLLEARAILSDNAGAQSIMADFSRALNDAYRQLRELLHHVPGLTRHSSRFTPSALHEMLEDLQKVRPRPNSRWIAVYPRWLWMRKCRCICCKL